MECDVVLAQRIVNHLFRMQVMDPIHLHDHAKGVPSGIEHMATMRSGPHHLTLRHRHSALATSAGEINFPEGFGATEQVKEDGLDEPPAPIPAHLQ